MDWLERILFVFLGSGVTLLAGFIRDRWVARRAKASEILKRYFEITDKVDFRDTPAGRINAMVKSGVPRLRGDTELEEFFREVTGRGYRHPWKECMLSKYPHLKPLWVVRVIAQQSMVFSDDADIYEWLLYDVTKQRDE